MTRQDELHRLMELATAMEESAEVVERRKKIDRREQLYHLDWKWSAPPGVARAVDPAPQYVGQRAEDKLCAQPFTLTCRAGSEIESAIDAWEQENLLESAADPKKYEQKLADLKKLARESADKKEAAAMGFLWRMEAQQGIEVLRNFAHLASVCGFAGPCRLGYDETAEAEPGVVPLYIQFLDPRSFLMKPDPKAGYGPQVVIYKRMATMDELRYEGWDVDGDDKLEADTLEARSQATVFDCWEKRRKKKGGKYVLELWHSIILDGPKGPEFLKKPINVAIRGCTQIPYVCVPVRPSPYAHEDYPGDSSMSFLDAFDPNWELMNFNLSWQAQMVQLAVNPPTLQKTEDTIEIDTTTPGAQNQVRPQEDAEIMDNPWARQEIGQLAQMLDVKVQKSTFTAPSYGEGNTQTSGLQTARLQASSEEGLGATRGAVEQALEQLFNLIALFARHYLADKKYVLPMAGGTASQIAGSLFQGDEIFEVKLPGMTVFEVFQTAMNARSLADPRPDGTRFISDETARELSKIVPWEHVEEKRINRSRWMDMVLEQEKATRLARATAREEGQKDMVAQFATQQQLQAKQLQFQIEQQKTMQAALTEPGQPQPPGQPASPMPESAPRAYEDFDMGDDNG